MQSNNLSSSSSTAISTVALDDVFRLLESEEAGDDEQLDQLLAELQEKGSEVAA